MSILRIEHRVADFDGWKEAFDSDPAGLIEGPQARIVETVETKEY